MADYCFVENKSGSKFIPFLKLCGNYQHVHPHSFWKHSRFLQGKRPEWVFWWRMDSRRFFPHPWGWSQGSFWRWAFWQREQLAVVCFRRAFHPIPPHGNCNSPRKPRWEWTGFSTRSGHGTWRPFRKFFLVPSARHYSILFFESRWLKEAVLKVKTSHWQCVIRILRFLFCPDTLFTSVFFSWGQAGSFLVVPYLQDRTGRQQQ